MSPIERTVKFVTTVDTLARAWSFVMAHLDEVGPDPHIEISPVYRYDEVVTWAEADRDRRTRFFEVEVHGMIEVSSEDDL